MFNALDDIVDKYNNTYHNRIKINPIDVRSNSYAGYNVGSNAKNAKFKIGNHVRISKYKIFSLKDLFLIGLKKFL